MQTIMVVTSNANFMRELHRALIGQRRHLKMQADELKLVVVPTQAEAARILNGELVINTVIIDMSAPPKKDGVKMLPGLLRAREFAAELVKSSMRIVAVGLTPELVQVAVSLGITHSFDCADISGIASCALPAPSQ